jgi:ribosome-associated protein
MAKTERKRTSVDAARAAAKVSAERARESRPASPRSRAKITRGADTSAEGPVIAEAERAPSRPGRRATASLRDIEKRLPEEIAQSVRAALDKKAQDIVVLDLRNTPAFTDFFVLCSGANQRQVKAIADAVEETLRVTRLRPAHTEGYDRAEWVLMDFFTFIVHVFTPQTRAFYALERLWGDAERIDVSDEPPRVEKQA